MHAPLKQKQAQPGWIDVPHADKIVHAVFYAVLGFLLSATLHAYRARSGGVPVRSASFVGRTAFGIAAVYGALDELTQPLTGRHCDVWDYATDLIGVAIGITVASRLRRAGAGT